jgi:hypothetical protein
VIVDAEKLALLSGLVTDYCPGKPKRKATMSTLFRKEPEQAAQQPGQGSSETTALATRFGCHFASETAAVSEGDESLVVDRRAELRPSQMVELKLRALLRGKALGVSHIQMVNSLRSRN